MVMMMIMIIYIYTYGSTCSKQIPSNMYFQSSPRQKQIVALSCSQQIPLNMFSKIHQINMNKSTITNHVMLSFLSVSQHSEHIRQTYYSNTVPPPCRNCFVQFFSQRRNPNFVVFLAEAKDPSSHQIDLLHATPDCT